MMQQDKVLCRFSPGVLFLPAKLCRLSADTVEVEHPHSGDVVVFKRPFTGGCRGPEGESADLDVVVHDVPSGKLINIGCPVLTPASQTRTSTCDAKNEDGSDKSKQVCDQAESVMGAYVQGRIVEKLFKPLRAKVMYSDGQTAWFPREEIRVMESPWVGGESVSLGFDAEGVRLSFYRQGQTKRKYSKRSLIPSRKFKKGELVRLPHGILKKVGRLTFTVHVF